MGGNQKLATLLVRFLGLVLVAWGLVSIVGLLGSLGSPNLGVPSEYRRVALWPGAAPALVGILIILLSGPLGSILAKGLDD